MNFFFLVAISLALIFSPLKAQTYFSDTRVITFIKEIAKKNNLPFKENINLFKQVKKKNPIKKKIIQNTLTPAEKTLSWQDYYDRLVNQRKILNGVAFWEKYQSILEKAEKKFNVPIKIIVATIGLESSYGKNLGKFDVFPTLVWLAFDGERRKKFYLKQLEYLLILRNEDKWFKENFFTIKSSYSGAMGWGQFIPQSYKNFSIDFNNDGNKNLITDQEDAIGSVAYYYQKVQWKKNGKVATLLASPAQEKKNILVYSYNKKKQYWKTHHNFKVIKRYNNNDFYALTVHLLANEIAKVYQKNKKP